MSSKSVMVIEDDHDVRQNIVEAFRIEGYKVYEAENGKDGLEQLLSLFPDSLPDCVILDLMMPVMDGEQFLNEIQSKHMAELGKLKILVVTAKGASINKMNLPPSIELLQKPFNLDDLYDAVEGRH